MELIQFRSYITESQNTMLKRSCLSTQITVFRVGSLSSRIESDLLEGREKPPRWDDIDSVDKKNIRRFLKRRRRQDVNESKLRNELYTLVTMAAIDVEGPLTTADINQFGTVTTRPNRELPQFLIFTGSEAPMCPNCEDRGYKPAKAHPDKMKCKKCSSIYTDRELAFMIRQEF